MKTEEISLVPYLITAAIALVGCLLGLALCLLIRDRRQK
jgi:hypothetical protein